MTSFKGQFCSFFTDSQTLPACFGKCDKYWNYTTLEWFFFFDEVMEKYYGTLF